MGTRRWSEHFTEPEIPAWPPKLAATSAKAKSL
jgi:hypothetical protein